MLKYLYFDQGSWDHDGRRNGPSTSLAKVADKVGPTTPDYDHVLMKLTETKVLYKMLDAKK